MNYREIISLNNIREVNAPPTSHADLDFKGWKPYYPMKSGFLFATVWNGYVSDFNKKFYVKNTDLLPKGKEYYLYYKWNDILDEIDFNELLENKIGSPSINKSTIIKAYQEKKDELQRNNGTE